MGGKLYILEILLLKSGKMTIDREKLERILEGIQLKRRLFLKFPPSNETDYKDVSFLFEDNPLLDVNGNEVNARPVSYPTAICISPPQKHRDYVGFYKGGEESHLFSRDEVSFLLPEAQGKDKWEQEAIFYAAVWGPEEADSYLLGGVEGIYDGGSGTRKVRPVRLRPSLGNLWAIPVQYFRLIRG